MIIYRNRPKIAEHFEWEVREITFPKEGAFKFELQRYVWDYLEFRAARYRRTLVDTMHGMIGHLLQDGPIAEFQRYRSIMFRHKRDYEEFMSAAFGSANQNHHWKLRWREHWMTIFFGRRTNSAFHGRRRTGTITHSEQPQRCIPTN